MMTTMKKLQNIVDFTRTEAGYFLAPKEGEIHLKLNEIEALGHQLIALAKEGK